MKDQKKTKAQLTAELQDLRNQNTIGAGLVGQDITACKKAEEARRESEEKYRRLFELGPDALILINRETTMIEDVNQKAVLLYGYSRDELLKMNAMELSAEPAKTIQTISDTTGIELIQNHRRRDGTIFQAEITFNDFAYLGRQLRIFAVRDVTARMQAEDGIRASECIFQLISQNTTDFIFAYDMSQRLIYANPALEKLTGYTLSELQERNYMGLSGSPKQNLWVIGQQH